VTRRPADSPESGDQPHRPGAFGPRTPIAAAEDLLAIEPVLVAADDHLDAVIRAAGRAPATRVLGVVDASGVLVGIVTSHDLVAAVVGRLAPGALLPGIHDIDGMGEYGRYIEARVAGDLMRPPATLPPTATLAEAFRLMHLRHLSGVYVVDASGRPVAYLDGLELAAAAIAPAV
jgi:CBS domain-containing protein